MKDWVQWEEVIYLSVYSVLESIIPKWKKLIHEVVDSLSKDVIKQRQADYSLGYDRGDLSVGYSNGLRPIRVRQCHHSNSLNLGAFGNMERLIGCYSAWALLDSGCHDF